jgi:signal transduction histidine kinase/CheY-like chemotaxis protein
MRIRSRLRIGTLLSMVLAVVVISSSVLFLNNIRDDLDRSRTGNDIIRLSSQLTVFIDNYKYAPSERLIQQIKGAGLALRTNLEQLSAAGEEIPTLGRMQRSSQRIEDLLDMLTENGSPSEATAAARREVITTNLQIMTRFLVDETSQFVEISHDRISRVSAMGVAAGASLFVFLFLANTAIVSLVSKRLRSGLERLTTGATQIGSGNLLHRISLQGRDELDDLAETFNTMAESLKQAQEELKKLALELEDRVRERTFELEQANRAKDEFLANMSHEVRTPVGEVIGMTDTLLQQEVPFPVRKDLEVVRNSSKTIMALLNDLLDLSRIEQGKLELHQRPFDIREVMASLVRTFEMQARDKGIAFETTIAEDVPGIVVCDPDRLGQVLKNLLSNALKFTETGSIRVQVHLDKATEHLAKIRFTVSDTGIGIPKEKIDEVFLTFTQLDTSYSKKFAGAGLGLAISKRLVELMGGEISVQSEVGKGVTFTFTVVFDKAVEAKQGEELQPAMALSDLPPLKILLAEDNAVNRLFLRRALIQAGHWVEEVENGKEVLERVGQNNFNLILMDIQMPDMDGLEATRRIRSGGYGKKGVPIVAITAYAMKGDREKFLAEGMDGYVTKPVEFGELARVIAEVCGISVSPLSRQGMVFKKDRAE